MGTHNFNMTYQQEKEIARLAADKVIVKNVGQLEELVKRARICSREGFVNFEPEFSRSYILNLIPTLIEQKRLTND